MDRFRLKSATVALEQSAGGKPVAILLPTGAEVVTSEFTKPKAQDDMFKRVTVECDGRMLSMFLVDLWQRGELVKTSGA